jgi:voltage-gated potassium channel
MDSFSDVQRQLRLAVLGIAIIIPVGVIGFMLIEGLTLLQALWLTVITLATVGYGDIFARTDAGKLFTIFLLLTGLSIFAFAIQAGATFLISPVIRDSRERRRTQKKIDSLEHHYIICGVSGELIDKTIGYLKQQVQSREWMRSEEIYRPVDRILDRIFGDDAHGHFPRMRRIVRVIILFVLRPFHSEDESLLDLIVVVTHDPDCASQLREEGLLVVEGDTTDDKALLRAGILRAEAMMVMLDSDTESLLTVLTARNLNPDLYITAATLEEELVRKMIRAGADNAIAPFEVAGQFLNNATLRPAVNDFFNSILFNNETEMQAAEIRLFEGALWIGQRIGKLKLREKFNAGVIGLRLEDGNYIYAPGDDYILHENEIVIVVAPTQLLSDLQESAHESTSSLKAAMPNWQRLPVMATPAKTVPSVIYSPLEAEEAVREMSKHYVLCGSGRVLRNAVERLNPERPFVIICQEHGYADELMKRGFRVIRGNPTQESTLRKAGLDRALAIMISVEDRADSVLTVLNCRSFNKQLLITAVAYTDDMVKKLHRAGADRITSPMATAAQFVLLGTTLPAVSDFLQYVLFNYQAGIETTELYMQDDSPWIGSTIEALRLDRLFHAGVIGIRKDDGRHLYAPPASYEIGEHDVLIVVTPMVHSDELRLTAHGTSTGRPRTLRALSTQERARVVR